MAIPDTLSAALIGLLEGLTEFLPVSSTGHIILLEELLGFTGPPGKLFEIVIQLGAILAIVVLYFGRLWRVLADAPARPGARRFVAAVLLAFLPAAVIGALAAGFIKSHLFSPWVVAVSLILGGLAILAIERMLHRPRFFDIEKLPMARALGVGFCQCLAMVPGVSRSGATIMGALLLGVDRRTATEFSFFLAIPTMFGATVYDLYKNRATLDGQGAGLIAIGFVVAFIAAFAVVRRLVDYISRHGFAPFAYYRIVLGCLALLFLTLR
jgi:undecaprenyl-diphosphatase